MQLSGVIVEIFVLTYKPCSAVNRYVLVKDVGEDMAAPLAVLYVTTAEMTWMPASCVSNSMIYCLFSRGPNVALESGCDG